MGEMITIPVEEYRDLCAAAEDLADLRAYDGAKAQIASGDDELVPADVVARLLAGDNPLRVWRHHRGLSQLSLSGMASVHRVQIANIESGRNTGSIDTVKRLAAALEIEVTDLI